MTRALDAAMRALIRRRNFMQAAAGLALGIAVAVW